ncbi:hypothetical protein pdam_00015357 [Pocillopora damicornis]|uniref:DDE Tnp4 domain-containing protein n=1 Tax=Pocillopora damicornis TaxID=46731 RepID=A0A3M6V1F3_POCDA|nr:hypothetical protein pdam_00015357 [Pocillopora damicornis]
MPLSKQARFKRRTLHAPNLIPVWVDPNTRVRLIGSNLIAKVNMTLLWSMEGRRRPLQMQLALSNLVARRKRFLNLTCLLSLLISQRNITVPRPVRSCRRLKRNTGWWEKVCNTFSDARFKKTFRVSRETFNFILNRTCSGNCDGRTNNVSNEACHLLGIGDYLYTISEMSGLGVSTVSSICQEVCQVLVDHLWNETVSTDMPQTEEEFKQKILGMEEFWQFPCCWTAIDGSHIPMKCPPGGLQACKEYHNFKNFYSIVLMAMVDSYYTQNPLSTNLNYNNFLRLTKLQLCRCRCFAS